MKKYTKNNNTRVWNIQTRPNYACSPDMFPLTCAKHVTASPLNIFLSAPDFLISFRLSFHLNLQSVSGENPLTYIKRCEIKSNSQNALNNGRLIGSGVYKIRIKTLRIMNSWPSFTVEV